MSDLPVTVYTAESPLRNPGRFAREMLRDLIGARELAWRLFIRDISAQYRQSILGYVWVFIPPLVASLPFIYLNSQGIVKIGDTPIPYAAYAIIGTTIWQVFADALNAPLKAINAARGMLARINLPREAILMSALAQVGLSFLRPARTLDWRLRVVSHSAAADRSTVPNRYLLSYLVRFCHRRADYPGGAIVQ